MKRHKIPQRTDWESKVEKLGFGFHTTDTPYWDESVYYEFTKDEIAELEKATAVLWEMCLEAVQFVIDQKLYDTFCIPEKFIPFIEKSWDEEHPSIYGRFDLVLKNGQVKMLEFNADTPTSLYEASVVQWDWLEECYESKDQFNSIHEKLVNYWNYLKKYLHDDKLFFTCVEDNIEDLTTVTYLQDCANQGGLQTEKINIGDIGWNPNDNIFVDLEDKSIKNIFKLYPWEWMIHESFGENLLEDQGETFWIEPAWKMILSNKAILPILWQLFPNHEYLLKASFCQEDMTNFVRKPILSREGANVELFKDGVSFEATDGEYGEEGFIYQELFELPNFDNNFPLIGSWVIGMEPAGIGIREAEGLITDNKSRFVPHMF